MAKRAKWMDRLLRNSMRGRTAPGSSRLPFMSSPIGRRTSRSGSSSPGRMAARTVSVLRQPPCSRRVGAPRCVHRRILIPVCTWCDAISTGGGLKAADHCCLGDAVVGGLQPAARPASVYALTSICPVGYIKSVESVFEIIAEPNRRAILSLLVSSEQSVGEIEEELGMSQPTVSKHLRVLRDAGFVEATVDAQRRVYRLTPRPLQELDAWLAPFRRFWSDRVDALERHLDRMDQSARPKKKTRKTRRRTMTGREQYSPGPANLAHVQKDGEKWTLILVRELRHSPKIVWEAITDPAHLREWAPFDADGSLGTAGSTVKLTTVGAPTPMVSETTVTRADAPKVLEYKWGGFDMRWELEAAGRRHAPDAVDQHRSPLHLDGCCRVAHLPGCSGSPSRRNAHRPHRCRRRHEVRGLAATECRVREAIRKSGRQLAVFKRRSH